MPVKEPLLMLKLPTVSVSAVPVLRVPPATVTAAVFAKRSLAPSARVPLFTFSARELDVPFRIVVPVVTVVVPAPRFEFTVPPCSA